MTCTRRPCTWTPDEDETLRLNFPMWPAFLVGHIIGRSASSVHQRAKRLGVEKHPDHWRNPMAHLWAGFGHPNTIASRIKPGATPANKGKRRPRGWAPGRMATTQFRPGTRPYNWQPVGSLRVDAQGYTWRKVRDGAVPARHNWRMLHVLMWEDVHGPVPKGWIVVFRNGDRHDLRLDNLEMIHRRDNARRNCMYTRMPPELARLAQMKGALTRRINRLNRQIETTETTGNEDTPR